MLGIEEDRLTTLALQCEEVDAKLDGRRSPMLWPISYFCLTEIVCLRLPLYANAVSVITVISRVTDIVY